MSDEAYEPFPDITEWIATPFDASVYDRYATLLDAARAAATDEARDHAVRTAIRYAGTDTGAIEGLYTTDRGFTRTVAIEAASWEVAANERGPNAAAIIKDQIEAYEWLLDLVTNARPVTEHVIRELHEILCRSQESFVVHTDSGPQTHALPKGVYKRFPNNPTSLATGAIHHYAPPDTVAPEMHRLVGSLDSDVFAAAHPVVQAAYLHYALAAIHPFADGNGRVARALASVPLYRALRVPLVVFRDQRDEYLDALESADAGNVDAFTRFVEERVLDVMMLVIDTTKVGPSADRSRSLEALRLAAARAGDIGRFDVDAAAGRLIEAVWVEISDQADALALPSSVRILHTKTQYPTGALTLPHGYSYNEAASAIDLRVESGPFDAASPQVAIGVFDADTPDLDPFVLRSSLGDDDLALTYRDVIPELRSVARIRVATWVERFLDRLLAEAARRIGQAPT